MKRNDEMFTQSTNILRNLPHYHVHVLSVLFETEIKTKQDKSNSDFVSCVMYSNIKNEMKFKLRSQKEIRLRKLY